MCNTFIQTSRTTPHTYFLSVWTDLMQAHGNIPCWQITSGAGKSARKRCVCMCECMWYQLLVHAAAALHCDRWSSACIDWRLLIWSSNGGSNVPAALWVALTFVSERKNFPKFLSEVQLHMAECTWLPPRCSSYLSRLSPVRARVCACSSVQFDASPPITEKGAYISGDWFQSIPSKKLLSLCCDSWDQLQWG